MKSSPSRAAIAACRSSATSICRIGTGLGREMAATPAGSIASVHGRQLCSAGAASVAFEMPANGVIEKPSASHGGRSRSTISTGSKSCKRSSNHEREETGIREVEFLPRPGLFDAAQGHGRSIWPATYPCGSSTATKFLFNAAHQRRRAVGVSADVSRRHESIGAAARLLQRRAELRREVIRRENAATSHRQLAAAACSWPCPTRSNNSSCTLNDIVVTVAVPLCWMVQLATAASNSFAFHNITLQAAQPDAYWDVG